MTTLVLNIVLITLLAFIINATSLRAEQKGKLFLGIAFCQLFIIHAFLDPDVMQDLPGYYETYQTFGENPLRESILVGYVGVKMEPGWIVLCKLLYYISHNPRLLLLVTSFVMVGAYCKSISKYSCIPWLSILIYLCTTFDQSLFVLRQHSAIALSLLSIPYILNREFKKYILIMLLAVSIHSTAIIFFPMYFVYAIKLKNYWFFFITVSILGIVFSSTVFPWLFSHTWYNGYDDRAGSNYTVFFITLCSLVLYLVSIRFRIESLTGVDKYFFLLISMAVLLCLCGVGFSPTNRLVKYFSVASIFVIPRAIIHFKGTTTKALIIIFVVFFHLLLFFAPSNTEYIQDFKLVLFE